jgi:hypothetical protein
MAKHVTIDEIHLTLRIRSDTPEDEAEVVRKALASDDFMDSLRRAVRAVLRNVPELSPVRASLTR